MTHEDAAVILGTLVAAFPTIALEDASARLWITCLADLDRETAEIATNRIIRNVEKFPTIAGFRGVYRLIVREQYVPGLPEGERQAIPDETKAWIENVIPRVLREVEQDSTADGAERPVRARWNRRRRFEPMLPPTDEEKSDAIRVMEELAGSGTVEAVALLREADRIFIEASS